MNRFGRQALVLLLLLRTAAVHAEANAILTQQSAPGWMADIRVWVEKDHQYRQFCKGALIAPQWVLSSGLCMVDPNHYLDNLPSGEDPPFYVKLGPIGDGVEVEKFYFSDDYRIALFRIALPSEDTPLTLGTRTASQLQGNEVAIWGTERSVANGHSFYNPSIGAPKVSCTINGAEFFVDGAFCFVQTTLTTTHTLNKITATVIDPVAATAPKTALDKAVTPDLSGKVLYLDFTMNHGYPCLEDVGAPVLAKAENGSDEIVGVVAGIGAVGGLPICGMSMANVFVSAAAIKSFADMTFARYDFAARCPPVPAPAVSYTGGAGISLHWNPIKGASGYKVHYTTRHGQVPIVAVDVKTQTTINTELAHGTDYLVAVSAYNGKCTSAPSKPLAVNVDVH